MRNMYICIKSVYIAVVLGMEDTLYKYKSRIMTAGAQIVNKLLTENRLL